MVAKEITSLQHKLVKNIIKLRTKREFREEKGYVFVAGKKMVHELAEDFFPQILFFTDKEPKEKAKEKVKVFDTVMKKMTGLPSPENLAAVFHLPSPRSLDVKSHVLVLDEIHDPGNLGTLFRTALGLKWDGIILTPHTVDPFNEKAVRASRGAVFHLPFCTMPKKSILPFAKENGLKPFIADIDGEGAPKTAPPKALLILSSESQGADFTFQKNCSKISLSMTPKVESYNVAASGSILLYLLRNR